jgi:hypothetical protein
MAITNGYCTLEQVKASLRITDSVDNSLLELAVESASREIDQACERVFYQQEDQTRIFAARDEFVCEIDDLYSLTHIKTAQNSDGVFDTTWEPKDYQLEPLNGFSGGIPHPATQIRATDDHLWPLDDGEALVQVRGDFGWESVPTAIVQATVILAARIYKRNDSPLGVAGIGDLGVIRVGRIDPDVQQLIHPFMKVRMG